MNKKTMILIMVVSITVVLFMSLWSMSAKENSEKILLFTPLPLLCVIASLLRLLLKAQRKRNCVSSIQCHCFICVRKPCWMRMAKL